MQLQNPNVYASCDDFLALSEICGVDNLEAVSELAKHCFLTQVIGLFLKAFHFFGVANLQMMICCSQQCFL